MARLSVTVACAAYDRTWPLICRRVPIEGCEVTRVHRRLAERQPIQRDDFFPGQFVGGTSAHGCNIAQRRRAAIVTARGRPNARPASLGDIP